MPDLKAHDGLRLLHRTADGRAAVLAAAVELDFLVALLRLDLQAPVEGDFLDRREEDVADLRVSRGEVAGVDPGPLPYVLTQCRTAYPRLARAEASHKAAELGIHAQEAGLGHIKARHQTSSRPLRRPAPE
ncbi:hypothetical protein D3C85_1255260 [compost metagenome]